MELKPFFWENYATFKGNAVWTDRGEVLSYSRLDQEVIAVGANLHRRQGLALFIARNSISCLTHYLAFLRSRVPFILLDWKVGQAVIDAMIERFSPTVIIDFRSEEIIWTATAFKAKPVHPDLALILPTSGSSGVAKSVMISYTNLQANAESIVTYLGLTPGERAITSLPFAYSYGLSVINTHLLVGAGLILTDHSLLDKPFWQILTTLSATSMAGVPFHFEIMEKLRFREMALPHLQTLTQAGGKLSLKLAELFAAYAIGSDRRFFMMYGQTEATARIAYLAVHENPGKVGSIGSVIPGGKLYLVDHNGVQVVESNRKGELIYEGPNVMLGDALTQDDVIVPTLPNKLDTGDIGEIDDDGFFWITGRKSRFIKLKGKRIDLDALQNALRDQGWDLWLTGDDTQLEIILANGQNRFQLENELFDLLSLHHSLVKIVEIERFPMTANGKPDYPKMRELIHAVLP
ncbi:MAG: AMP-binding protein [Hahellaceae bacterium]|nr:AMP-binding protein [Hahellaceae bacterium]